MRQVEAAGGGRGEEWERGGPRALETALHLQQQKVTSTMRLKLRRTGHAVLRRGTCRAPGAGEGGTAPEACAAATSVATRSRRT